MAENGRVALVSGGNRGIGLEGGRRRAAEGAGGGRGGTVRARGRVALVGGGSGGLGLEVCRRLAEEGLSVILGSRDEERGRQAAEGLPGGVAVGQLDGAGRG